MGKFDEDWRARFEQFGRGHEADHLVSGWSARGLERRLSVFAQLMTEHNLKKSFRILDVGCGAGTYIRLLAERGFQAIGLDYSLPSLQRARMADPRKAGTYLEGDAYRLPFFDETFEVVVSIGTFQAMENPRKALKEMVRVLRPNGLAVVECLNSREIISQMKTLVGRMKGAVPNVRTYPPQEVERWLATFGVNVITRKGVYLPPRQFSQATKILDFKATKIILNRIKWLSLLSAHAFLLVGKKSASG